MSGLVEQYAALVPLPMHEVVRRLMWVELRAAEAGETGAEQGVPAMVAAVRVSRPQKVCAPWPAFRSYLDRLVGVQLG